MVEVTQADRDFAAPWIAQSVQSFSERSAYRKEIEAGEHDAHPIVIAAATHRIEAAKAERDRLQQKIEALKAALRETMSRCTDCGGRGSFVKHDEVTDRDLWESCASCAVGYAALESQP